MPHKHKFERTRKDEFELMTCGYRYCMRQPVVVVCHECREYRCAKHAKRTKRTAATPPTTKEEE